MTVHITDAIGSCCRVEWKGQGATYFERKGLLNGQYKVAVTPGTTWVLTQTAKHYCRLLGPHGCIFLCLRVTLKIFGAYNGEFDITLS